MTEKEIRVNQEKTMADRDRQMALEIARRVENAMEKLNGLRVSIEGNGSIKAASVGKTMGL